MERGLLWLPLLLVFFWLAWNGWNEYQKVESYRHWAEQFDKAKYDIYAVLGYKDKQITWGKPTRKGAVNLQTFSLNEIQSVRLLVNDQPVDFESLPSSGSAKLEFISLNGDSSIIIPFTEISLAAQWGKFLQQEVG
ncbi:conserved hypothetical protein [Gloeothece citriformis PCC 7424]|uniref:Uncharacterized protein n=1 Tax=Gloeothece citriformis (strain PCC 7424) TaxID=65393 RepID=B7KF47_GLOC7|nr:hypothetical protein [Gloeothece citriformis]ACK70503.1 conserved hypothetical protein [Gloeothece citriformis PCC 7424]